MLIAITGPDGSGKSTTCNNIKKVLDSYYQKQISTIASVWDNYQDLFDSEKRAQEYLKSLNGTTRTLFIFHALNRALDLAKKRKKEIIIIDGYWYKYAVSEIALGTSKESIYNFIHHFPVPDITFYLDINPQEALSRKKEISNYEQGNSDNYYKSQNFILFQTKLKDIWKEIELKNGPWIHYSSKLTTQNITENMLNFLIKKVA